METLLILLVLLVILLLVAAAGHALWLGLAALWGLVLGRSASAAPPALWADCPGCGEPVPPGRRRCPACELVVTGATAGRLRDLEATLRQLTVFHDDGTLDDATFDRLRRECQAARKELLRPRRRPQPQPLVEPLPVAPKPEEELLEVLPVDEAPAPPRTPVMRAVLLDDAKSVAEPPAPRLPEPPAPRPPEPVEPTRPPRSWGEVLGAFMEERNILWGELVGGLLIVGCSVALVISLWERLEAIPYFPFLIFAGITAALFGAGLYTLHHWKLESTSRGLLVIALLLVPLNFVVLAGLSAGRGGNLLEAGTEVVSLAVFAGLVTLAARVIVPERPRWLALSLIGPAAASLLVPRLLAPGQAELGPFLLLGSVPVACFLLACGGAIFLTGRRPPLAERSARDLLALLGLASFALVAALGFLVYRAGDVPLALRWLALPVALSGVPILAGGLLVYRGDDSSDLSAPMRTVACAVGLAGMAVMLAAAPLAWPEPSLLIAVCLLDFAVLTTVALAARLPVAHAAALPCLAVAYLTGFHLAAGHLAVPLPEMARHLLRLAASPAGGSALVVLVVGIAAASEFFVRRGRAADAVSYLVAAVAIALASLAFVFLGGVDESGRAALVCGAYALTALALNVRWRRSWLAYGGLLLVLLATLWGVHAGGLMTAPARALVVAAESLVLGVVAVIAGRINRKDIGAGGFRAVWDSIPAAAWRDVAAAAAVVGGSLAAFAPGFPAGEPHAATAALLALTACALAWSYRWAPLAWAGSALLLAAILHALVFAFHQPIAPLTFVAGLLAHATATLALATVTRRIAPAEHPLRRLLAGPLQQSGLLATACAAGLLPFALGPGVMGTAALYAGWLAALWLLVSWDERRPVLFSLGQIAAAAAILFGVTWWLEGREWVAGDFAGLTDPRSLHAYGIALAAFSLVWLAVRTGLRRSETARPLLEPPWPAVDRVVFGAVVLGQLALAVAGALPGVVAELSPADAPVVGWPAALTHAYGPGAWGLLTAVALVLVAALWERPGAAALGLLLAAVTVPVLAAGAFAGQHAVASALRWGLGGCFLVASVPLWLRGRIAPLTTALRIPPPDEPVSAWGRRLLVALTVGPVLLLTIIVALVGFSGSTLAGPDAGSFFGRVGWVTSNVLPLVLVSAGLVGYGVRDRLPGYAFAAGLVADAALMGGYALHVVLSGGTLDGTAWVRVVQLGTLGAGLWAAAWLIGRRTYQPEALARDGPSPALRGYMEVQLGLGALGNALLLIVALVLLTFPLPGTASMVWTREAGTPLGWIALAMTAAAFALGLRRHGANLLGLFVLAAAGLLACSVERLAPGWGNRALMLAWAASTLAWVSVVGMLARRGEKVTLGLSDAAATWVTAAGMLTLLLGLKSAFGHGDAPWAAAAIGLVSIAGAGLAVQRRQEGWAFVAGLGTNLAASLLVGHFFPAVPFDSWGVSLLQANAAACATVALLWLAWRRLYGTPGLSVGAVPLLGVQVVLGLAVNAALVLMPLTVLVLDPSRPLPAALIRVGGGAGWLALALAAAAALVYTGRSLPRGRLPIVVLTGLAAGVLAACLVGRWDAGHWLSYHVLLAEWTVVGLAVPAAGIAAASLLPDRRALRHWMTGAGLALVLLAVRGAWDDPARPYWSAAAILSVVVSTGILALWSRRPIYVYASGQLVNLVGFLAWLAWGTDTTTNFLGTQALCLALAAGGWSVVETVLRARTPPIDLRGRFVSFTHAAVTLALILLGAVVAVELSSNLAGTPPAGGLLAWAALAVAAAVLLILLWDDRAVFAPVGLYAAGLLAVGLTLSRLPVAPARVAWFACLLLAGYTLLTAAVVRVASRRAGPWFLSAQAVTAALALVLSVGVCVGFDAALERFAGPLAVALLGTATFLLVGRGASAPLRYVTLALGVVLLTELGWAALAPSVPAVALHRNVLLMSALAAATVGYGAGLARATGRWPDWAECGRRCGPVLGVLALVVLLGVLGQEFLLYNPDPAVRRTPMLGWAVAVVTVALLGLIAAQLRFALMPERDPFGLSERRRTLYVYAAELLLVGLFLHVRLNVPGIFGSNFVHYWTFAVMGLAYAGVGLAELFQRRNLPVLAGPLQRTGLFLPLLPLLAFWVRPPEWLQTLLESRLPGTVPLLAALNKLPTYHSGQFDRYALVWFLLGALYVAVALARRSSRYVLLAALAANVGLWCLLYHHGWAFLVHPQLWLVPLALIVLVAEHLNRERLGQAAATTLRYAGLGLLYLSSTADMFIAGLGRSAVLPLVLALLSVAGVLAGILLRVRAFLLLGVGFLGLVVFSMIWHAAVDLSQTWVWWASGIVLGLAILGMFALFEKRRNDVLRVVERIREWD